MGYKSVIGIDPGNAGAIAAIIKDKVLLFDMPIIKTQGSGKTAKGNPKIHTVMDEQEIRNILLKIKPVHVFIEKSQSMPGQGVTSMFNYAASYGIIRGICVGLQIPYTLIHPATWKRSLMKDMDKGKGSSIMRAKQLYPKADIGKKDGRAEALLILHYGLIM